MRLLDLFCCAGGAAMGYHQAGFEVVGVDINPQPRYPFEFHQGDALEYLEAHGHKFDAIHASPPCHDHSALSSITGADGSGWLLDATRDLVTGLGKPWVIENVEGARLPNSLTLCGTQFGLRTHSVVKGEVWLKRHRLFESSEYLVAPGKCHCHGRKTIGVYGTGGAGGESRGWKGTAQNSRDVMGIHWMNRWELAQAIPPVYTQWVGAQLLDALEAA